MSHECGFMSEKSIRRPIRYEGDREASDSSVQGRARMVRSNTSTATKLGFSSTSTALKRCPLHSSGVLVISSTEIIPLQSLHFRRLLNAINTAVDRSDCLACSSHLPLAILTLPTTRINSPFHVLDIGSEWQAPARYSRRHREAKAAHIFLRPGGTPTTLSQPNNVFGRFRQAKKRAVPTMHNHHYGGRILHIRYQRVG